MTVDVQRTANIAVAGERRLLTVMFCDLVGSTALSESLDPEDYAEVVLTYQETGRRIVENHGGVVAQFAGDGLVIQFGYPTAHENDAERAVTSAFVIVQAVADLNAEIGRKLGVTLRCRIGVHAGITVVGRMGAEGRNDMALFGTTANIAARVQAEAEPGDVIVTEAVITLLNGDFATDFHRWVTLRGIAEPVEIARITGKVQAARLTHRLVVARVAEQDQLVNRWNASTPATLAGRCLLVSGPAGIGKSTLTETLRRHVDPESWIEVRARELSMFTPFASLTELATRLGEGEAELLNVAAADVISAVQIAAADSSQSAEQGWHLVIEATRRLGRAIGSERRLILIEDIHWLDASSRVAIEAFAAELAGTPSLLVATARPPASLGVAEVIDLVRLDDADIRDLVRSIADGTLGDDVIELIVERAEGVPLFAAAMTRASASSGTAAIPDSLHASLLARLDRFPDLRRVAQVASVLGDVVVADLLASVTNSTVAATTRVMDDLVEADILSRLSPSTTVFTHALLREAIYQSLLARDRRQLHSATAVALTEDGARGDDRLPLVGHHLEYADEPVAAAECYATAARQSARSGAFAEAIGLTERGLRLLPEPGEHPAVALALTMTQGNARFATDGYSATDLTALWCAAEEYALAADNRQELSSAMNGQSAAPLFAGNYALAIERAERVRAFGERHQDRSALLRGHCSLAIPQLFAGDMSASLDNARHVIELYQDGDDELLTYGFGTDHGVIAYSTAGMAAWFAGHEDADDLLVAAVDLSERIESPISLCLALQQAATIDLVAGRYEQAYVRAVRLTATARRFALPLYVQLGHLATACAQAWLDRSNTSADPVADANAALAALMTGTSTMGTTLASIQLALCQEGVGDTAAALETARFGLAMGAATGEHLFDVELAAVICRCDGEPTGWSELLDAASRADERGAHGSADRARVLYAAWAHLHA